MKANEAYSTVTVPLEVTTSISAVVYESVGSVHPTDSSEVTMSANECYMTTGQYVILTFNVTCDNC